MSLFLALMYAVDDHSLHHKVSFLQDSQPLGAGLCDVPITPGGVPRIQEGTPEPWDLLI